MMSIEHQQHQRQEVLEANKHTENKHPNQKFRNGKQNR